MENYTLANGNILKIEQDTHGESPRSWDNLAKMLFFGRHSHIGDNHDINSANYKSFEELEEAIKKEYDIACITKIYGYSHSGLTISTKPFSCAWDSGILGFSIITKKDLRENYSRKRLSKQYIDKGYEIIESEISVLDQFIIGDVYGFMLEGKNGEHIDSCSGFYGSNPLENGMIDHLSEELGEELSELLK